MNDISLQMSLGLMSRVRARLGFVLVGRHLGDMDRRQITKAISYLDELRDYIYKAMAERRASDEEASMVQRSTSETPAPRL